MILIIHVLFKINLKKFIYKSQFKNVIELRKLNKHE